MTARAVRAFAILVAGGRGRRFRGYKQLASLAGEPVLAHSLRALQESPSIERIAVVLPRGLPSSAWGSALARLDPRKVGAVCAGGEYRVESVRAGFRALAARAPRADVIVVHDAARPLARPETVEAAIQAAARHGGAVAAAAATDTVKWVRGDAPLIDRTIPRDEVYLAQTPQAFRWDVLDAVIRKRVDPATVTDEATLVERSRLPGIRVAVVPAPRTNMKITDPADLACAETLLGAGRAAPAPRIGHGFDLHRLVRERPLVLGGVRVQHPLGLLGHSDGDVLLHALTDALLGAAGEPDIGALFPDTDAAHAGAASRRFLAEALRRVHRAGYRVANVDLVLHAERPRIAPHASAIKSSIARLLRLPLDRIGLKAKTHEKLGDIGRGRAMAATAMALLVPAPGGGRAR